MVDGSFLDKFDFRQSPTMLLPLTSFLCVCLCSELVATQRHWRQTKTTFNRESTAAAGSSQSRGGRPVPGEDNGGSVGAGDLLETPTDRRALRKSAAGDGALRTDFTHRAGEPGNRGQVPKHTEGGPKCGPGTTGCHRRPRRSPSREKREDGAAMAQEQESGPFGLNTSDYEDYSEPDFPGATPLGPVVPRPTRPRVKNPFYPVTGESYGAYALLLTAAVIFSVGIIGNVSVMCIVCHNYYMRSVSNSLLANLALWDFTVIFFCLPLVVFRELTKDWLLGDFSCRIIPYLEVASLGVTTFTLCALCIDRFRAATNVRLYYEMMENWASTAAKLAVIWVGALLLALPELLLRQLVTESGEPPGVAPCERCVIRINTELPDTLYVLGLTYDGARLWWYFGCYFCLPTLFTICSSLVTARKIRGAERASVRGTKKQIQLESQMNCAVVALAILYGFCIIPENVCNIVTAYMAAGIAPRTLDVLQLVSQMLLFCKSAVTPVLLFSLCRPFTRAFLDCCCCCCDECGPQTARSGGGDGGDDGDEINATELELSPFSTMRREASTSYAAVGTHC